MEREVFERAKGLDDRIQQIDSVLKINDRKNLCISINPFFWRRIYKFWGEN